MENVAALSKALDGIRAGINSGVSEAGAEFFEDRLPLAFAAANIEDASHRALEVIFRHAKSEQGFSGGLGRRDDTVLLIPIPLVKISPVISGSWP